MTADGHTLFAYPSAATLAEEWQAERGGGAVELTAPEPEQSADAFHLLGPVDDLGVLGVHVLAEAIGIVMLLDCFDVILFGKSRLRVRPRAFKTERFVQRVGSVAPPWRGECERSVAALCRRVNVGFP